MIYTCSHVYLTLYLSQVVESKETRIFFYASKEAAKFPDPQSKQQFKAIKKQDQNA